MELFAILQDGGWKRWGVQQKEDTCSQEGWGIPQRVTLKSKGKREDPLQLRAGSVRGTGNIPNYCESQKGPVHGKYSAAKSKVERKQNLKAWEDLASKPAGGDKNGSLATHLVLSCQSTTGKEANPGEASLPPSCKKLHTTPCPALTILNGQLQSKRVFLEQLGTQWFAARDWTLSPLSPSAQNTLETSPCHLHKSFYRGW